MFSNKWILLLEGSLFRILPQELYYINYHLLQFTAKFSPVLIGLNLIV